MAGNDAEKVTAVSADERCDVSFSISGRHTNGCSCSEDWRNCPDHSAMDSSSTSQSKGEVSAAGIPDDRGGRSGLRTRESHSHRRPSLAMPGLPANGFTESSGLPPGETARREAEAAAQVCAQGIWEKEEELSSWWFGALITFGLAVLLGVCWAIRYL